ncbi:SDR family oxidoreductase [Litoreibacter janthinus]|uniref:NAD(P)-dependent dehydrogenase, short-chain alcohol dehydrogenase family n=1 Tax=Litoreibacter janthinus TaxID=670154 RepID=A0A1I6G535_9RHOB|nr:SDR family oxidoreductase [Litoreibacter janthinus]SFR37251.1 NAD(P)-dependent dehydrogenase, short-chain alcohol dehydrogenase family [Litoreibacter janthinus]
MINGRALVTGGADRLGRAMSLQLADMGFDVAVHYGSSQDAARETVALIEAKGRKASALQADLLDLDAVEALLPAAVDALGGPLTVLINNASIFEYDSIDTATRESWNRHMASNFQAPFLLTQAFAKQAPSAGIDNRGEPVAQAAIINMIDQRVRKLTPEFMTYTLAKMGLWALTQTSAQALAPAIRVNAIGPGPTMQGARQSDGHFARQRDNTVLKRGSNPEDITAALAYILNAPALTGQLLCIDAGQHLGWQTPDVLGVE